MFVIVNNGYVILGPKAWNKLMFEEVLLEECEVEYTLPTRNEEREPFTIDDNTIILPVRGLPEPAFNSLTQRLDGPFWNLTDTEAEMYYTVGDLPLEAAKNKLKDIATANRYTYEVMGIKVTIQDQEVSVDTARGLRDIYQQTYLTMSDEETITWKFSEVWLAVTKADLLTIVQTGKQHIQDRFAWEQAKYTEIESCETREELEAVVLTELTEEDPYGLRRG